MQIPSWVCYRSGQDHQGISSARSVCHPHTGPIWRGGKHGEDDLLKSCYQNCLALAAAQGCRSVAFPSISTGVYRFPLERAAAIAVAAIKEGLEAYPQLEKVMMVCFDNATKAAYEKALQNCSR